MLMPNVLGVIRGYVCTSGCTEIQFDAILLPCTRTEIQQHTRICSSGLKQVTSSSIYTLVTRLPKGRCARCTQGATGGASLWQPGYKCAKGKLDLTYFYPELKMHDKRVCAVEFQFLVHGNKLNVCTPRCTNIPPG